MSQSFLYVIAASTIGPVKLGISKAPEKRVRQLQTGHAQRLHLFHTEPVAASSARMLEGLLHKSYHHVRMAGEWFDMTAEDAIASVKFILIEHGESDLT